LAAATVGVLGCPILAIGRSNLRPRRHKPIYVSLPTSKECFTIDVLSPL
jgi:hypothetical protein